MSNAGARNRKRSIKVNGHATSISLEDEFYLALSEIAVETNMTLQLLVEQIDSRRGVNNLSSAIRVHVLEFYRDALGKDQFVRTRKARKKGHLLTMQTGIQARNRRREGRPSSRQ